jgi:TonB family protein
MKSTVVATLVALGAAVSAQEIARVPPEAAALVLGKVATVCGHVIDRVPEGPNRSGSLTFLTPSGSARFTVAIARDASPAVDLSKLSPPQRVCVTGLVRAVKDGNQIVVDKADQVVVDSAASVDSILSDEPPPRICEGHITTPRARHSVPALHTADAMRRKVNGVVILGATVDVSGNPRNIRVLRSLDPDGLDLAAVDALRLWQFEPARCDGEPLPYFITVEMTFTTR